MTDPAVSAEDIRHAARLLGDSRRLVVLTGAGISKESGIPTFRDAMTGLWARFDPEQLATPQAFERAPKLVWDWYTYRRELLADVVPNPGHYAIAALEALLPQVVVVTQNVDGLHQAAGSTDVITLHGDLRRNKCSADCRGDPTLIDIDALAWDPEAGPPTCPHCGAWVRPDIVWFGELLPEAALLRAFDLSEAADVMLVVGTSGVVQPAAQLPFVARRAGAAIIEVNPDVSEITPIARLHLRGPSGVVLPQVIDALRSDRHA